MADFMPTTASNGPKVKDHARLEQILIRFYVDPDFKIGVGFDYDDGQPQLFMYGCCWPEAWKLPDEVPRDEFDPCMDNTYERGAEEFVALLKEIAPQLQEPLIVHAVGVEKCRFPLAACEWRIDPEGDTVWINGFQHGYREQQACVCTCHKRA